MNACPYAASLSRTRYRGAVSHGNASTICCASHSAVGCVATANHNSRRRPWLTTRNANRHPNVRVGTTQRSIAAMASAWLRRNVRHVCDGGPPVFEHVLGDRRLSDFEAKLEEFAVDAWGTPQRIVFAH